jgi:hypothetical protein
VEVEELVAFTVRVEVGDAVKLKVGVTVPVKL